MAKTTKQDETVLSIATFDIETSNLNANFGIVLCAVIKPMHGKEKVYRLDKTEAWKSGRRYDDSELVCEVIDELNTHDILIAHNGVRFDKPFLNTRALCQNAPAGMPILDPRCKMIDPVLLARKYLRMSWNSLDNLLDFMGLGQKTKVTGNVWMKALLGNGREGKKNMDEVVAHCIIDVVELERLVGKIRKFVTRINEFGR